MTLDLPKSVRQIGCTKGNRKIYIEDYVMSFVRQLAKQAQDDEAAGVLLGRTQMHKGIKYLFVSGMVRIHSFEERTNDCFSHDMWTNIYTDIKENFTDVEIVGWFYTKSEMPTECNERLRTIHGKNFGGGDKILFLYEEAEGEEALYVSVSGVMEKQPGYYIYYEKNPEMREYMVKCQSGQKSMEQIEDTATQSIRSVLQAKKGLPDSAPPLYHSQEKKETKHSFGMGAVVVILALILGFTALKNQDAFEAVSSRIETIKENMGGSKQDDTGKTEVETIGSGLSVSGTAVTNEQNVATHSAIQPTTQAEPTPVPQPTTTIEPTPTATKQPAAARIKAKKKETEVSVTQEFHYYIVQKGDTLSQISEKFYHSSLQSDKIKTYNNLDSEDKIWEGQKLKIPK